MYSAITFAALSGFVLAGAQTGVTGKLGNALITSNNPPGVSYTATLPDSPKTGVRGSITATSNSNDTGVAISVNLFGFPDPSLGPFLYHIHDQPVPANGNCTATLAHLDPFIRGEIPPCDSSHPETCQVGDLSGKHGKIATSVFTASYIDLYVSTQIGLGSFLGNRSIVIHTSNTTRLTCANFRPSNGTTTNSTTSSTTPTPAVFTGAGNPIVISVGAMIAGLAAFFL